MTEPVRATLICNKCGRRLRAYTLRAGGVVESDPTQKAAQDAARRFSQARGLNYRAWERARDRAEREGRPLGGRAIRAEDADRTLGVLGPRTQEIAESGEGEKLRWVCPCGGDNQIRSTDRLHYLVRQAIAQGHPKFTDNWNPEPPSARRYRRSPVTPAR